MATAVDTNILIYVLFNDPVFSTRSVRTLTEASSRGRVIVCDTFVAELGRILRETSELRGFLTSFGLEYVPTSLSAAGRAG